MKSIRIGQDLHDRMKVVGDKFGHKVNTIARKALFSWERKGGHVESIDSSAFSTQRNGGTVLRIDTEIPADEVRVIIEWYISPYESMAAPSRALSKSALRDIKKYNESVLKFR